MKWTRPVFVFKQMKEAYVSHSSSKYDKAAS